MVQYDLKSYFGKLSREVAWVIIAAFGHVNSLPRKFKANRRRQGQSGKQIYRLEATDILAKFVRKGRPHGALFGVTIGKVIGG